MKRRAHQQVEDMLAADKSEAGQRQPHNQDLSDMFEFEELSEEFEVIFYNGGPIGVISEGDTIKLRAVQRQNFGNLYYNAKTGAIKQLTNNKAMIRKGDTEELESELESELEEKKPPDLGMRGYNAKVMKVMEVLNEAGDMTADFFKTEAEKESKLVSKLGEKKPPEFGMLDYKAKISKGDTEKLKSDPQSEADISI